MKRQTPVVQFSCLLVLSFFLTSCVPDKTEPVVDLPEAPPVSVEKIEEQIQLPVQYLKPSYMVDTSSKEEIDEVASDVSLKVGASIRSTQGPQPLWDILKRLAALKRMSVSWASDVDQNVLVDVDINANDEFYTAIDNLLRQVDFYHEMNGSTIVVR
ncbi:MAG: type II and III secretion system protein, partial [Desulfocapsa sp.]|nr:type II and III secretion system protein [Desulfocapsa sp.]